VIDLLKLNLYTRFHGDNVKMKLHSTVMIFRTKTRTIENCSPIMKKKTITALYFESRKFTFCCKKYLY